MTPSQRIDQLIAKIPDWRGKTFAQVRKAILAADAGVTNLNRYNTVPTDVIIRV